MAALKGIRAVSYEAISTDSTSEWQTHPNSSNGRLTLLNYLHQVILGWDASVRMLIGRVVKVDAAARHSRFSRSLTRGSLLLFKIDSTRHRRRTVDTIGSCKKTKSLISLCNILFGGNKLLYR